MQKTNINNWKAARQFPLTYPGDRPRRSYFLLNDDVYLINWEDKNEITSAYIVREEGEHVYVDRVLENLGLPGLLDRYAVLAYGANRNPATLKIKMHNYNYINPGKSLAVPVLKGFIMDADVVACNIYGQGYLYADLLFNSEYTANTEVESWLTLLDKDQLRVINDSENIKKSTYVLGRFPGFSFSDIEKKIIPLGYAGNSNIFVSPELNNPISFSTVSAKNRKLPEMQPLSMLNHLLDVFGLRKEVAKITGLDNDNKLGVELSKYLNGQWWYSFNTKENPIKGYLKTMERLENRIRENSLRISTADYLKNSNMVLTKKESYSPGLNYTLRYL